MSSHRIAVVQAASRLFDLAETLRRVESLLAQSTVGRPELVVFPEAFIGGCPKGATVCEVGPPRRRGPDLPQDPAPGAASPASSTCH
jgi:nitrilase